MASPLFQSTDQNSAVWKTSSNKSVGLKIAKKKGKKAAVTQGRILIKGLDVETWKADLTKKLAFGHKNRLFRR
jgi:hypothetical protein